MSLFPASAVSGLDYTFGFQLSEALSLQRVCLLLAKAVYAYLADTLVDAASSISTSLAPVRATMLTPLLSLHILPCLRSFFCIARRPSKANADVVLDGT